MSGPRTEQEVESVRPDQIADRVVGPIGAARRRALKWAERRLPRSPTGGNLAGRRRSPRGTGVSGEQRYSSNRRLNTPGTPEVPAGSEGARSTGILGRWMHCGAMEFVFEAQSGLAPKAGVGSSNLPGRGDEQPRMTSAALGTGASSRSTILTSRIWLGDAFRSNAALGRAPGRQLPKAPWPVLRGRAVSSSTSMSAHWVAGHGR